jgi:hypothetical protein
MFFFAIVLATLLISSLSLPLNQPSSNSTTSSIFIFTIFVCDQQNLTNFNDHFRALSSALVYLHPVIQYQSYAFLSHSYRSELNQFRSLLNDFSRLQTIIPSFLSQDENSFGFEYLNPLTLPQHQHHFHFNSNLLFTRDSPSIFVDFMNDPKLSCSPLSTSNGDLLNQILDFISSINLHLFGIQQIHDSFRLESWCSVDALLIPSSIKQKLYQRLKALHMNYKTYSSFNLREEDFDHHENEQTLLIYHTLLFNLALWREEIPIHFIITNYQISFPYSPPHIIIFPPNSTIVYQKLESINQQSSCQPIPIGFDLMLTIASLIIDLHTPHLCYVLGRYEQIQPLGLFVDIGSFHSLSRASLGSTGMTVLTKDSLELNDQLRHHEWKQYLEYLNFKGYDTLFQAIGSTAEDISFSMIYTLATSYFSRIAYYRLSGCYSSDQLFHLLHDPLSNQNLSCQQNNSDEQHKMRPYLKIGSVISQLYQTVSTQLLPCLISIHPGLIHEQQRTDFNHEMIKIGMLPSHMNDVTIAIGPHCREIDYLSLIPLLDDQWIVSQLMSITNTHHNSQSHSGTKILLRNSYSRTFITGQTQEEEEDDRSSAGTGIGTQLIQKRMLNNHSSPLSPIAVIENILPLDMLELLRGRLAHRAHVNLGANSHFIHFNSTMGPRSLVEEVILEYLSPLVVGTQVSETFSRSLLSLTPPPLPPLTL